MSLSEVVVGGARSLRGRLRVPGDKSISHRALLFAALADGRSTITGLATGADVAATRRGLELLGVKIKGSPERLVVSAKGVDALREPEDRAPGDVYGAPTMVGPIGPSSKRRPDGPLPLPPPPPPVPPSPDKGPPPRR